MTIHIYYYDNTLKYQLSFTGQWDSIEEMKEYCREHDYDLLHYTVLT